MQYFASNEVFVATAYIALGSNLGDRLANLRAAIGYLDAHRSIQVRTVSSVYESEPLGPRNQDMFYNAVAETSTDLAPLVLLHVCQQIEKRLKRKKTVRWGPRTIDLDILLYGSATVETRELTVPHREMRSRLFVLLPLLEIAPDAKLPSGQSVRELLARTSDKSPPVKVGTLKL